MQVKINGKPEEVTGGTVLDLLKTKNIEPQMVAVEVNDKVLDRDHLATTHLKTERLIFARSGDAIRNASHGLNILE